MDASELVTTKTRAPRWRGHVEAEREAENWNDDFVERNHEHVDHVAEEEPDAEMNEHQSGRLLPMKFFVGLAVGLSHGSVTLPA